MLLILYCHFLSGLQLMALRVWFCWIQMPGHQNQRRNTRLFKKKKVPVSVGNFFGVKKEMLRHCLSWKLVWHMFLWSRLGPQESAPFLWEVAQLNPTWPPNEAAFLDESDEDVALLLSNVWHCQVLTSVCCALSQALLAGLSIASLLLVTLTTEAPRQTGKKHDVKTQKNAQTMVYKYNMYTLGNKNWNHRNHQWFVDFVKRRSSTKLKVRCTRSMMTLKSLHWELLREQPQSPQSGTFFMLRNCWLSVHNCGLFSEVFYWSWQRSWVSGDLTKPWVNQR